MALIASNDACEASLSAPEIFIAEAEADSDKNYHSGFGIRPLRLFAPGFIARAIIDANGPLIRRIFIHGLIIIHQRIKYISNKYILNRPAVLISLIPPILLPLQSMRPWMIHLFRSRLFFRTKLYATSYKKSRSTIEYYSITTSAGAGRRFLSGFFDITPQREILNGCMALYCPFRVNVALSSRKNAAIIIMYLFLAGLQQQ